MAFFKHENALVETENIGQGTRIRAFAHVLPGAKIGCDCEISDHTFLEGGVILGDRVTVQCGVQLWNGVRIEDDVFIGPNATFAARFGEPNGATRSHTVVKRGASIGANATILGGVTIEENVTVGAGTVVTRNVPRNAVVSGNPAVVVSYAGAPPMHLAGAPASTTAEPTQVEGVVFHRLPLVDDPRGLLSFAEVARQVPFEVKRYFLVFQVPSEELRGEHAHRAQHQFLVCVHGRCAVVADDGIHRQEFFLDAPNLALYLPPMTWAVEYKYSRDAVLLALSSGEYDPADYIRDYAEFLALKRPTVR
jgi:UDP-2-acetamido-3-amino-2,3-dideoxy-glucuronate N-acetyltransferase